MHLMAGDLATAGGNRVSLQNVVNGCSLFVEGTFNVNERLHGFGNHKNPYGQFQCRTTECNL